MYARKIDLTGTYYILKHQEYARLEDGDSDQHLAYSLQETTVTSHQIWWQLN